MKSPIGPGNALLLRVTHEDHVETFTGHGERGLSAEKVAVRLADAYLRTSTHVGEHLSDPLLLPMVLVGNGTLDTCASSERFCGDARLIEKFLPIEIAWQLNVPIQSRHGSLDYRR